MVDEPPWLTVAQASKALRVTEQAIRARIKRKTIPHKTSPNSGIVLVQVAQPVADKAAPNVADNVEGPVIAELRDHVASLRAQLAEHQADRARWHDTLDAMDKRAAEDRAADRKRIQELERLLSEERSVGLWRRLLGRRR